MNRRHTLGFPIGLAIAGAALAGGCSHKDPLLGTWVGTMTTPRGGGLTNTWTFTDDGKTTTTMTTSAGMTVTTRGTYTDGAGTLTQTITSASEPGRTRTYPHPVGIPYQYTVNGDTLTISGTNTPDTMVFTRQAGT